MPDSNVYIGHVPFDSSYKHTIWFSSAQDQHDQMMQHMSIALSDVNYTHIREGAPIRVPHNTETLTGCNYLMYNNGGKWYYNFITGIFHRFFCNPFLNGEKLAFEQQGPPIHTSKVVSRD